jgi:hypothetical protein
MSGVFPPELNLPAKGEIVTNKNIRPKRKRGGKSFVVRIAQSHDRTVLTGLIASANPKQTEVPI